MKIAEPVILPDKVVFDLVSRKTQGQAVSATKSRLMRLNGTVAFRKNTSTGRNGAQRIRDVSMATKDKSKSTKVGKVYRGKTKYIDKETKSERNYVVVFDDGSRVKVSKLKSIKIFDENNKNDDDALIEINSQRYGLKVRTGVDFQVFDKNRMSKKNLTIEDKRVFPKNEEEFSLGSHDLHRTLKHTIGHEKKEKGGSHNRKPPRK